MPDFQYQAFLLEPNHAFPNARRVHRPLLEVHLLDGDTALRCYALADTGADICMFPTCYAEKLGLDPARGIRGKAIGTAFGTDEAVYYHVRIRYPKPLGEYLTYVAFVDSLNARNYGVLGAEGFFDRFSVCFNYDLRKFSVDPLV